MNKARAIFKYENGAEEVVEVSAVILPEVFCMKAVEGCAFYFVLIDELPSGTLLYKETTEAEMRRICGAS